MSPSSLAHPAPLKNSKQKISMDEVLVKALGSSFNPDQSQREQAETFLTNSEKTAGYLTSLIRIWVNPAVC